MLDLREGFEAWLWSLEWVRDHHFYRRDMKGSERHGQYVSGDIELAWEAWQARGTAGELRETKRAASGVSVVDDASSCPQSPLEQKEGPA